MKVCFDVNTVIYLYTNAPQQAEVFFSYDTALVRGFETLIPACSLADIHYILHRNGLSGSKLNESMGKLFDMFEVFDANGADGKRALESGMKDFEDALIAESAHRNGVDLILTYNTKDYKNSPVPAMLPGDFLKDFKADNVEYAETGL